MAAGELVFEGRKNGLTSISTKSTDTDVVTEFDRASERLIVEGLRAERPDDAVVGEEGTDCGRRIGHPLADRSDRRHHQLPVRPARLRACRSPRWSDDGPLAGAVYIPATDELFTAIAGGGAMLNGITRSTAARPPSLQHALVATGF